MVCLLTCAERTSTSSLLQNTCSWLPLRAHNIKQWAEPRIGLGYPHFLSLIKFLDKIAGKRGLGCPRWRHARRQTSEITKVVKTPSPWRFTSKNEVNNQGPNISGIDIGAYYHTIGLWIRFFQKIRGLIYWVFDHGNCIFSWWYHVSTEKGWCVTTAV